MRVEENSHVNQLSATLMQPRLARALACVATLITV